MATGLLPLPSLIEAAATDDGNRSMERAGRRAWSVEDYGAAAETLERLRSVTYGEGRSGRRRFAVAIALEAAGRLTLGMSLADLNAEVDFCIETTEALGGSAEAYAAAGV